MKRKGISATITGSEHVTGTRNREWSFMKRHNGIRQLGFIILTIVMILSGMCSDVVRADSLLACMPQASSVSSTYPEAHDMDRERELSSHRLERETFSYQPNQGVEEVFGTRGECLSAGEAHRQISSSKRSSTLAQSVWTVCVRNQRFSEERKCSGIGKNVISRDIIVCYMHHKDGSKG